MEFFFDIVRLLGNIIAKYVFANKFIEGDSILSDAVGGLALIVIIISAFWLLRNFSS